MEAREAWVFMPEDQGVRWGGWRIAVNPERLAGHGKPRETRSGGLVGRPVFLRGMGDGITAEVGEVC
jgi:hypothetical protein